MNRNILPPLSYYPQLQNIENLDISNGGNFTRSQTATNPSNINNNQNSNNYLATQNLLKEIRDIKTTIKNQLQNQNELQQKLIESYKLISQQDNIIRVNTLKINEHDEKLKSILSSINNFLKITEKTNISISDCQNKINNILLPIDVFNNFKNQIINNNVSVNENIKKLFAMNDNNNLIFNDLKNVDENNLRLLLNKIKTINDKQDSFNAKINQENVNFINEHNNVILSKINQLKDYIDETNKNISEEINCRKFNDEKIFTDITNIITKKYEDRFKIIEKNSLETEKNLINMNKDYIKTFQDILSKQKEGNETEFSNLKNMLEIGLRNNQLIYEDDIKEMKKLISTLKCDFNENKSIVDKIDSFVKENIKIMNEFEEKGEINFADFAKRISLIDKETKKFSEDSKNELIAEIKSEIEKEQNERFEYQKKVDENINNKLYSYDKKIADLIEKCKILENLSKNKYESGTGNKNVLGINNIDLNDVYENKINKLNNDLLESNKKLREDLDTKISDIKTFIKNNFDEYSKHVDNDLYKKFEVLSTDIKEKSDKTKVELDGKMQEYIAEAEERLKEKFEKKVA